MTENPDTELIIELSPSQKRYRWATLLFMVAIIVYLFVSENSTLQNPKLYFYAPFLAVLYAWSVASTVSDRYIISNQWLIHSSRSFLLQPTTKKIALQNIAKAEHTNKFLLYDQDDNIILNENTNDLTPQVYSELRKRLNLPPQAVPESNNLVRWLKLILIIIWAIPLALYVGEYIRSHPTKPAKQVQLGERYRKGDGVEQNDAKAFYWYNQAAAQGHVLAQYYLGQCYRYGRGVNPDIEQAAYWYRKAAEHGHTVSQIYTGICYEYGYGVEQDYEKAMFWYKKAQINYKDKRKIYKYIQRCSRKMHRKKK